MEETITLPITINTTIKKNPQDYFKTYLKVITAISDTLKLSELEILILNETYKLHSFNTRKISKVLNKSDAQINNYKGELKEKKLLVKLTTGEYILNPKLNIKSGEELNININIKSISNEV